MNIFKLEYDWYEGEHDEILVGKNVKLADFEKDLTVAKVFAQNLPKYEGNDFDYLGKGYHVQCRPEYYKQIIWYLTDKLGYIECCFYEDLTYSIDDELDKKIKVIRSERRIDRTDL